MSQQFLQEITCLIVTYNSADIIARCLQDIPAACPIIVIDNASHDNTLDVVQEQAPRFINGATIITSTDNLGYGPAANRGLDACKTPYAILLNPDVFLDAAALLTLRQAAEASPTTPLLGPAVVDNAGNMQAGCKPALFSPGHNLFKRIIKFHRKKPPVQPKTTTETGWLVGCSLFFNVVEVTKLGRFDDNIFLYYEETDLCYRAVLNGTPPLFVPEAKVVHLSGQSSTVASPKDDNAALEDAKILVHHFEKSRFYLAKKYASQLKPWEANVQLLVYRLKAVGYKVLGKRKKAVLFAVRVGAAKEGCEGRPG